MVAEEHRSGAAPLVARWLERPASWLRPNGARDGREAYQLRFLTGAIILTIGVTVLSMVAATALQQWLVVLVLCGYLMLILAQVVALRLGAAVNLIAWTIIATVGALVVVSALLPSENQLGQLYWFLLIPLTARALMVHRNGGSNDTASWRAELFAGGVALAAVSAVILYHAMRLGGAPQAPTAVAVHVGIDVALFLLSVLGLLYVHDLSTRETQAELKRLRQLLSMCAWCRDIKHDGKWMAVEQYVEQRQDLQLTHGMCPTCYERHWKPNLKTDP